MKTEEEINKFAEQRYPIIRGYIANKMGYEYDKNEDFRDCFIKGYIQCQQDMAEQMSDLLAWWMVNKGEQYRNETLFVDAVKDYINSLNK